jgi:hypothetical protein
MSGSYYLKKKFLQCCVAPLNTTSLCSNVENCIYLLDVKVTPHIPLCMPCSQLCIIILASVDLDCCLNEMEREQLHEIPLQKPLSNIMSSVDNLNLASMKISEVQDLIDKEQNKRFEHLKALTSTWGSVALTIVLMMSIVCCSCCCCRWCRQCGFWLWDKWTPKECIRHTKERCVITNINADRVSYHEIPPSLPLSPTSTDLPLQISDARMSTRRRSPGRPRDSLELVEFNPLKTKERMGER